MTKDPNEAAMVQQVFNSAHNQIRFEMEEAHNGCLKLLDLKINVEEGGLSIGFYRKEARTNMFMNANTALPTNLKDRIVANERARIGSRCQDADERRNEMIEFDRRLKSNGFRRVDVEKMERRMSRKRRSVESESSFVNNAPFFFSVPFVSDPVNGRLRKLFRKNGIHVIIALKGRTLRNLLQKTSKQRECKIPNCTTPRHLCHRM